MSAQTGPGEDDDQGILDYFASFQSPTAAADNGDNGGVSPISPGSPTGLNSIPRDDEPYPHCPLYIPSRGRGDQERGTMALLVRDLIPFTVVVEPEEGDGYRQLIDHMVFASFGAAGMAFLKEEEEDVEDGRLDRKAKHAIKQEESNKGSGEGKGEGEEEGEGGEEGEELRQCSCCRYTNLKAVESANAKHVSAAEGQAADARQQRPRSYWKAVAERRRKIAQLYHHGYSFLPLHQYPGGDHEAAREDDGGEADGERHRRVPAPTFLLSSVDEVRSLFRVVELPRGHKGVSYARNYILQVLVPADMVAATVDRTGHVDELELFSANCLNKNRLSSSLSSSSSTSSTGAAAATPDTKAYLGEEQLRTLPTQAHTTAAAPLRPDSAADAALFAPHGLYGYYWVMDDDIYSFFHARMDGEGSRSAAKGSGENGNPGDDGAALSPSSPPSPPPPPTPQRKNVRVSAREMMRQVAVRMEALRQTHLEGLHNSGKNPDNGMSMHQRQRSLVTPFAPNTQRWTSIGGTAFTCKEDCLRNNLLPVKRQTGSASGGGGPGKAGSDPVNSTSLNTSNYSYYPLTACVSLEYSRFAYTYDDTALAVNSYNNIACLFHYGLLHSPREEQYFPRNMAGVRDPGDVLGCGLTFSPISVNQPLTGGDAPHNEKGLGEQQEQQQQQQQPSNEGVSALNESVIASLTNKGSTGMLWYKFTVREDYDFTLQLIARGMYTLRFRNLSFDVPQMAKLRGGMTSYYKNCSDEIRWQNEMFVRQWPAVAIPWVKGKNSTERDDIKVRWDLLHPARARFPGAFLFLAQPLPQIQQQPPQQVAVVSRSRAIAEQASGYSASALTSGSAQQPQSAVGADADVDGHTPSSQGSFSKASNTAAVAALPSVPRGPSLKDIIHQKTQAQAEQQQQPLPKSTFPGPAIPSGVTWKGKRHWGSDSEEEEEEEEGTDHTGSGSSSGSSKDSAVKKQRRTEEPRADGQQRQRTEPLPSSYSPVTAGSKPGWKGYAVEPWRDVSPTEAARLGLRVVPLAEQRIGKTVAVIPTSFSHNPSCVLGTLIERLHSSSTGEAEWTVVAQRAKGIPLLSVPPNRVYEPPEEGVDAVASAVDDLMRWRSQSQAGVRVAATQSGSQSGGGGGGVSSSWLDE